MNSSERKLFIPYIKQPLDRHPLGYEDIKDLLDNRAHEHGRALLEGIRDLKTGLEAIKDSGFHGLELPVPIIAEPTVGIVIFPRSEIAKTFYYKEKFSRPKPLGPTKKIDTPVVVKQFKIDKDVFTGGFPLSAYGIEKRLGRDRSFQYAYENLDPYKINLAVFDIPQGIFL
jgi:hypothetical protein